MSDAFEVPQTLTHKMPRVQTNFVKIEMNVKQVVFVSGFWFWTTKTIDALKISQRSFCITAKISNALSKTKTNSKFYG